MSAQHAPRARLLYACFDEVPSFKGASSHVLAVCRTLRHAFDVTLRSLGRVALPAHRGFRHEPFAFAEPNYLRRAERFREHIAAQIAEERPQLGHFRSPWEGLALVRAGVPSVYEVNGLPSLELPQYARVPERVLDILARDEHECLHRAAAIVCPSPRIAECVAQRYGIPAGAIEVIPNGYDPGPICDPPNTAPPLRAVYLGTLHPWQGLHVMWPALEALAPRVMLDVYAPPHRDFTPHLQRVLARRQLGSLVRLLPPLHRAALGHALPRYHLGLAPLTDSPRNTEQGCCPLKILDYLAHGLPVLATDLPVVRQLLRDGHNALLVRPSDAVALTRALGALLDEPSLLARLRRAAQPSLSSQLSWLEHGERVVEAHRRVLSSSSTAASSSLRSRSA